jgi:uncharacterized membrane protein
MKGNDQLTAYQKVTVVWVSIFSLGLLFGTLFVYASTWFMIPFFGVAGIGSYLLNRIVCPNCGARMTYETSFLGVRVPLLFMRDKCKECGWDLKNNP